MWPGQARLTDTETVFLHLSMFSPLFPLSAFGPYLFAPTCLPTCSHSAYMSWSPEDCRGHGEPPGDRHTLCARLVEKPSGESAERPESGPGPIVTRTASGPALAFWQAVLAGDVGSVSRILADSSTGLRPDSIFDTSDPEQWRDFRFNIRALSTGQGHWGGMSGRGGAGVGALGSLFPASGHLPHFLAALRLLQGLRPMSLLSLGLWSLTYEEELTTPLHVAASRGHTDVLQLLLRRRARPDSAPGGRTALHEACAVGHAACAHALLVAGADPNIPDQDGKRPLHLCRGAGTLE